MERIRIWNQYHRKALDRTLSLHPHEFVVFIQDSSGLLHRFEFIFSEAKFAAQLTLQFSLEREREVAKKFIIYADFWGKKVFFFSSLIADWSPFYLLLVDAIQLCSMGILRLIGPTWDCADGCWRSPDEKEQKKPPEKEQKQEKVPLSRHKLEHFCFHQYELTKLRLKKGMAVYSRGHNSIDTKSCHKATAWSLHCQSRVFYNFLMINKESILRDFGIKTCALTTKCHNFAQRIEQSFS